MFLFLFTLALSAQNDNDTEKKVDITVFEAFQKFFGSIRYVFEFIIEKLSNAFSPILPPIQFVFSTIFGSIWNIFCILLNEIGSAIRDWQIALIQSIKGGSSIFSRSNAGNSPSSTGTPTSKSEQNVNTENENVNANAENANTNTNAENVQPQDEVVNPGAAELHIEGEMANSNTQNLQSQNEEVANPSAAELHIEGEINKNDNGKNSQGQEAHIYYNLDTENTNQEGSETNSRLEDQPEPTPGYAATSQPGSSYDFEIQHQKEFVSTTTPPTPEDTNEGNNNQHTFTFNFGDNPEGDKKELRSTITYDNQNTVGNFKVEINSNDQPSPTVDPIPNEEASIESNETPAIETPLPDPNNTPEPQTSSTPEQPNANTDNGAEPTNYNN